MLAMWTRIWWVRPVFGLTANSITSRSVASCAAGCFGRYLATTVYFVMASRPNTSETSLLLTPSISLVRRGASIVPSTPASPKAGPSQRQRYSWRHLGSGPLSGQPETKGNQMEHGEPYSLKTKRPANCPRSQFASIEPAVPTARGRTPLVGWSSLGQETGMSKSPLFF